MRNFVNLVGLVEPLDNQSEIYVIASALVFIKNIEFVRIAVSQINYNSWKGTKPKEKNLLFSSSNSKRSFLGHFANILLIHLVQHASVYEFTLIKTLTVINATVRCTLKKSVTIVVHVVPVHIKEEFFHKQKRIQ